VKIAIVLGTRPEIIKMAPVIRECNCLRLDYFNGGRATSFGKKLAIFT